MGINIATLKLSIKLDHGGLVKILSEHVKVSITKKKKMLSVP